MKAHTSKFKENISLLGRELDSKITYTIGDEEIELGNEDLNSVSPFYEGNILKSVMKQLDIDSNVEIPVGTVIKYEFGVLVDGTYEYLDYGNYIVKEVEKQEDTRSWKITCYDKLLASMKDYVSVGVTYPTTIRNYINAICEYLGITFANAEDTFANYNKEIPHELYLSYDEATQDYTTSMGYTFRDVLDELAQVTASSICINENDELEIRYLRNTQGKNLYGLDFNGSNNGIDFNSSGSIIFLDGETSGSGNIYSDTDNKITLQAGTYTASIRKISGEYIRNEKDLAIYVRKVSNNQSVVYSNCSRDYNSSSTFTINEETDYYIQIYTNGAGIILNDLFVYIQIEKGEEETSFEPYGDDVINEEYLKDVNVNFGELSRPINTIVVTRIDKADSIYYPETIEDERISIIIEDNQIMNRDDRNEYLPDIYNVLNGLTYYINDYTSTGICYYDLCDKYRVKVDNKYYNCIMLNDEVNVTQGLKEEIYTDLIENAELDYKKADTTDRRINTAYVQVDKANGRIDSVVKETLDTGNPNSLKSVLSQTIQTVSDIQNIFQITGGSNLIINSQYLFPDPEDNNTHLRTYWNFTNNGTNPYQNIGNGFDGSLAGRTTAVAKIQLRDIIAETSLSNIVGLKEGRIYTLNYSYNQSELTTTNFQLFDSNGNIVTYSELNVETGIYEEKQINFTYNEEETDFRNVTIQFIAPTSTLILKITTATTSGDLSKGYFYLYDLMLNSGDKKSWEPARSEVYSTVLKMSQLGLQIISTGSDVATLMNASGFGVYSYNKETNQISNTPITNFISTGLTTDTAETKEVHTGNYVMTEVQISDKEHHIEYFKESD